MTMYAMKNQMLKECEDEISQLMKGTYCSQKFIKLMCRNKINYLRWKISRIQKDKSFDVVPSTVYIKKWDDSTL